MMVFHFLLPDYLMRLFQISNLNKEEVNYFANLTLSIMTERKKNKGWVVLRTN